MTDKGWSHKAYGSLFRAIRGAGFHRRNFPTLQHTIMVAEPEAAAYFTVRELLNKGTEFLVVSIPFTLTEDGHSSVRQNLKLIEAADQRLFHPLRRRWRHGRRSIFPREENSSTTTASEGHSSKRLVHLS